MEKGGRGSLLLQMGEVASPRGCHVSGARHRERDWAHRERGLGTEQFWQNQRAQANGKPSYPKMSPTTS